MHIIFVLFHSLFNLVKDMMITFSPKYDKENKTATMISNDYNLLLIKHHFPQEFSHHNKTSFLN